MKWLAFVCLIITFNIAAKGQAPITLNGPWKFHTGDNLHWADSKFNDTNWQTVDLTAPPGAHDGDVGLSGYVPGWEEKGHRGYAGYAWYRIRVALPVHSAETIALTGPPDADDAYQVFANGVLLGGEGDFSGPVPVAYSIRPKLFLLPGSLKNTDSLIIAFRVWMSAATLDQASDAGGIHIAPKIGRKDEIEPCYNMQWKQTIYGYVADAIEPAFFVLLAVGAFILFRHHRSNYKYLWLCCALCLSALVCANQPFYYWAAYESSHEADIVTTVILTPLVLAAWTMTWLSWFRTGPSWLPKVILGLTLVYIAVQLFGLSWLTGNVSYLFNTIGTYVRLLFLLLLGVIVYKGIRQQRSAALPVLPAVILISAGLFAQELSLLNVPGIWFPFGVGVSRTQFVYAAFDIVLAILLLSRRYRLGKDK